MAVSLSSWIEPAELDVPIFDMPKSNSQRDNKQSYESTNEQIFDNDNTQKSYKDKSECPKSSGFSGGNNNLINSLMSLLGNSGGLDISSILGLLDRDGKSDSMLKVILPLLFNGGLGGLFGGNKKSSDTNSDDNTINLDDYKKVK